METEIKIGQKYEFVSEIEGPDGNGIMLRNYTGQQAEVLRRFGPEENDPENSPMYLVRFPDGVETGAWEEELSGWDKERGQYHTA